MAFGAFSQCLACDHYRSWTRPGQPSVDGYPVSTCSAYPDAIPATILLQGADHRTPIGGEAFGEDGRPVTFTLRPGSGAANFRLWWTSVTSRGANPPPLDASPSTTASP